MNPAAQSLGRKKAKAKDQAARRARWSAAKLCLNCGRPPAVRITQDADGMELHRKVLTRCGRCL